LVLFIAVFVSSKLEKPLGGVAVDCASRELNPGYELVEQSSACLRFSGVIRKVHRVELQPQTVAHAQGRLRPVFSFLSFRLLSCSLTPPAYLNPRQVSHELIRVRRDECACYYILSTALLNKHQDHSDLESRSILLIANVGTTPRNSRYRYCRSSAFRWTTSGPVFVSCRQ